VVASQPPADRAGPGFRYGPSPRLRGGAGAVSGAFSGACRRQIGDADKVVHRGDEHRSLVVAFQPEVGQLPTTAYHLDPAEDLVGRLADRWLTAYPGCRVVRP
jgi:hypothetical protein